MRNGLQMETGPRFLKPAILGAVAIAFGAVTYAIVSPGDAAPKPAAAAVAPTALATADDNATSVAPTDESAINTDTVSAPAATAATTSAENATAMASTAIDPAAGNTKLATASTKDTSEKPAVTAPRTASATVSSDDTAVSEVSEQKPAAASQQEQVADSRKTPRKSAPKMLRSPAPPASDALRTWWVTPETPQRLGVEYVGQAADQNSLVIRFNQQVGDPAAEQNIRLVNNSGETVAANWKTGENPSVLFAPNLEPGRYTVVIGPELASVQGQSLGVQLHGPAFIQ